MVRQNYTGSYHFELVSQCIKLLIRLLDNNLDYVFISTYIHEKLVASQDGVNGVCLEHTPCEGVVFFAMFQNIFNNMEEEDNKTKDVPERSCYFYVILFSI